MYIKLNNFLYVYIWDQYDFNSLSQITWGLIYKACVRSDLILECAYA